MEAWNLIESDPEIFTKLISDLGVQGVEAKEIHVMEEFLEFNKDKIFGLIFCFNWTGRNINDNQGKMLQDETEVYFPKQIINNACATQAILSILLNHKDIKLGDDLSNFKQFSEDFPSELKGEMIGSSDLIRNVHNSFSGSDDFVSQWYKNRLEEMYKNQPKEDAFHFSSFCPVNSELLELDGLKEHPISHGKVDVDNWVSPAFEVIQNKIQSYGSLELRFNLMALVQDESYSLKQTIISLEEQLKQADTDSIIQYQLVEANERLNYIMESRDKTKKKMALQRHNHLPFLFQLLGEMANNGRLGPSLENYQNKD